MRLAADAGLLVAAERRVRRIGVVAVGPDAAGLDGAAEAVGARAVAGPDAGAEAVERVVGDGERFVVVLEACVTETTGPKISSWKTRILLWPSRMVGWT